MTSFLHKFIPHIFCIIIDINKGSPIDYKSNVSQGSACSTPTKDTLKQYDRAYTGPMIPTRGIFGGSATNTLGAGHLTVGSQHHHHHHYSTPLNFRKGITSKCTWKCTAILVIMLCVILFSILVYMSGMSLCLKHDGLETCEEHF